MAQVQQPQKKGIKGGDILLTAFIALIVIGIFIYVFGDKSKPVVLTSDQFITEISQNNIKEIYIKPMGGDGNQKLNNVYGIFVNGDKYELILNDDLVQDVTTVALTSPNVKLVFVENVTFNWTFILMTVGTIIMLVFIVFIVFRNNANSNNKAFDFGKTRARLAKKSGVTFNDVAGVKEEKEELVEVIDFLKNPQKYFAMGAKIPKGILLVGAPGTGKTLLARAVAGEANVPFYSISGSDFVEMFVGVGASRVRDMFKVAKQTAPCIIFIDEIDAGEVLVANALALEL